VEYASGDVFEGTFEGGAANGPGRVQYASGQAFEGQFANNLKHG
jgi:hypothetical protein